MFWGAMLRPSWGNFGASWAHLGLLERSWGHLWASWGHLGPILGHLGPNLGHLGANFGGMWSQSGIRIGFYMVFAGFCGPNLCRRPRLVPAFSPPSARLLPDLTPSGGLGKSDTFVKTIKSARENRYFRKAVRAQPLNRRSLFAIQWIERIGFSLPAFTGFDTQLSGLDPLRRIYGLPPLPPTPLHQCSVSISK